MPCVNSVLLWINWINKQIEKPQIIYCNVHAAPFFVSKAYLQVDSCWIWYTLTINLNSNSHKENNDLMKRKNRYEQLWSNNILSLFLLSCTTFLYFAMIYNSFIYANFVVSCFQCTCCSVLIAKIDKFLIQYSFILMYVMPFDCAFCFSLFGSSIL